MTTEYSIFADVYEKWQPHTHAASNTMCLCWPLVLYEASYNSIYRCVQHNLIEGHQYACQRNASGLTRMPQPNCFKDITWCLTM